MTLDLPERLQSDDPSDVKNAEIFAVQHGTRVRWTKAAGWRIWTETRWALDTRDQIMNFAAATARTLPGYIPEAALNNKDLLRRWMDHLGRSQNVAGLKAMLEKAHSEPGIAMDEQQFDADPWLLNCANVTVNLQTGATAIPRQDDYLTKHTPIVYDPHAVCPRWNAFLYRVLGGDADLIRFVRLAIGYTLTGATMEQCVFFLHGGGKNGKSTFINILQALLGEYTVKMPLETFLLRRSDGINWNMAELFGKRLAVASEVQEGRRLDEAAVKDISGGDRISAQRKHQHPFEFDPTAKLWMYGNHKPIITGTDEGIRRRIKLLPFTQFIPPAERDTRLEQKLRAELPGILAQAVHDCVTWQTQGLEAPSAVTDATAAYFVEMDILAPFLSAYCVIHESATVLNKVLYATYVQWAEENGVRNPISGVQFSRALNERGFRNKTGAGNRAVWYGIGVRADTSPDPPTDPLGNVRSFSPNSVIDREKKKYRENHLTLPNTTNGHTAPLCPRCGSPQQPDTAGNWLCWDCSPVPEEM